MIRFFFLLALIAPMVPPVALEAHAQASPPAVQRAPARADRQVADNEASLGERMNANTITVISGTPGGTYFRMASDLAFVLDESVPADRLDKALRQAVGDLLVDIDLFDVYRGPVIGDGRRSLAYRLRLQAPDRNLTDADVASVRERCAAAAGKLGAQLRS